MNWITSKWYISIAILAIGGFLGFKLLKFLKLPTAKQIDKIKEWLIFACMEAEKELGGKTGQLKLRFVYDKFISKFAGISSLVSFEYFRILVDEALLTVRRLLEANPAIANYVGGDNNETKTIISNK